MEEKIKVIKPLQVKIQENQVRLTQLVEKKVNLEREIANLEQKISNQKFAQEHIKKES